MDVAWSPSALSSKSTASRARKPPHCTKCKKPVKGHKKEVIFLCTPPDRTPEAIMIVGDKLRLHANSVDKSISTAWCANCESCAGITGGTNTEECKDARSVQGSLSVALRSNQTVCRHWSEPFLAFQVTVWKDGAGQGASSPSEHRTRPGGRWSILAEPPRVLANGRPADAYQSWLRTEQHARATEHHPQELSPWGIRDKPQRSSSQHVH